MDIVIPRYIAPGRKIIDGLIPPSPPAERRHDWQSFLRRYLPTFTGRMPQTQADFAVQGLINGGMVNEGHAMVDGGIIRAHVTASSILTDLKFSYSFETTGWLDNLGTNNLTGTNSPTLNASGQIGKCIAGTGGAAGPYASVAYNAAFNFSSSSFTVTAWSFFTALTSFQGCWSKSSAAGSRNYCLFLGNDSQLRFIFIPVSVAQTIIIASNFGTLSLNTWYFSLCSFDVATNTWSISINNGTANTTVAGTAGVTNATDGGFFVMWDNSNNMQTGRGDEINGWNRLLTTGEKAQLAVGDVHSAYNFS